MAKIDIAKAEVKKGAGYPAPFDEPCAQRVRKKLGDAGGLEDFGVNLLTLPPGAWSSQRHWHSREDEFIYVLSGALTLVTDGGEQILRAGDCAAFPKNSGDGHHFINRSYESATCLEVGTRSSDDVTTYSDIDLRIDARTDLYTRKDGTPYPDKT